MISYPFMIDDPLIDDPFMIDDWNNHKEWRFPAAPAYWLNHGVPTQIFWRFVVLSNVLLLLVYPWSIRFYPSISSRSIYFSNFKHLYHISIYQTLIFPCPSPKNTPCIDMMPVWGTCVAIPTQATAGSWSTGISTPSSISEDQCLGDEGKKTLDIIKLYSIILHINEYKYMQLYIYHNISYKDIYIDTI